MNQAHVSPAGTEVAGSGDAAGGAASESGAEGRPGAPDPAALVRAALGGEVGSALDAIRLLRPLLDEWEKDQVLRARELGWNWADIAKCLGRHRQAVHREYGPKKSSSDGGSPAGS